MDPSKDPVTPDTLQVLQFRAANDPWLPRLKTFVCEGAAEAFIPFVPLFLSRNTTQINIAFAKGAPTLVVASAINRLSAQCPDLASITLSPLPRDPVIAEAVSEMLLACNQNTLKQFCVDSPLTEEAREVVYRLPRMSCLWTVIQGPTSLPAVALPNLTGLDIEYDGDHNWLQGFHSATLDKLEMASIHSRCEKIGDFLEAFERVALATSAQNKLSDFRFYTSRSWNPNYSCLLSFNQLQKVEIWFSCEGGCSSKIDDDIIISLAQAMPKLELLLLGKAPCATPTGITAKGLIGLARLCPRLSKLRIHFKASSLVEATTNAATLTPSAGELVWRQDCALTDLEVGKIPIPMQSDTVVTLALLQIFPRILNIGYTSMGWRSIAGFIKNFRQFGAFVHRSGEAHPSYT